MKTIIKDGKTRNSFLLIFLCFFFTSSGYLSWLYNLMRFTDNTTSDILSEVLGYILQAIGVFVFVYLIKNKIISSIKSLIYGVVGFDLLCICVSVLSNKISGVITFGLLMNVFHGILTGYYLYELTDINDPKKAILSFALGYSLGSFAGYILSTFKNGTFLKTREVLMVYVLLAALIFVLVSKSETDKIRDIKNGTQKTHFRDLALLMFSFNTVKNVGFSFPSVNIKGGVNLELVRLFYALSLIVAGYINSKDHRTGAICCVASLGYPFFSIALNNLQVNPTIIWCLSYLFQGFFNIYRIILFVEMAMNENKRYLAPFGLAFGRIGEATGTSIYIALQDDILNLTGITLILFASAVFIFFKVYGGLYGNGTKVRDKFDRFTAEYDLSAREKEIFEQLLDKTSSRQIAERMFISESTVKFHIHNILNKTGCKNRKELVQEYNNQIK